MSLEQAFSLVSSCGTSMQLSEEIIDSNAVGSYEPGRLGLSPVEVNWRFH